MASSSRVKQANYQDVEVEQMCPSWLIVSNNPIVGAGQKADTFWTSIQTHFHSAMNELGRKFLGAVNVYVRSLRSLQSKWGDINHDCAKFFGNFSTIEALDPSGKTEEQLVEMVLALYQQTHKKGSEFSMMGARRILRDAPKWHIATRLQEKQVARKKKGSPNIPATVGSRDENDSPNVQQYTRADEADGVDVAKPMGNKKAKELASLTNRGQKGRDGLAHATSEIVVAMKLQAEVMEEVAIVQLFTTDLQRLDHRARSFLLRKRAFHEIVLKEKMDTLARESMDNISTQENFAVAEEEEVYAATPLAGPEIGDSMQDTGD